MRSHRSTPRIGASVEVRSVVTFCGLADQSLQEVVEFFATREEAERTLRQVLRDEPDWREILSLVRVEFGYDEALIVCVWRR